MGSSKDKACLHVVLLEVRPKSSSGDLECPQKIVIAVWSLAEISSLDRLLLLDGDLFASCFMRHRSEKVFLVLRTCFYV